MIVETSTYKQIFDTLLVYEEKMTKRMEYALAGHGGRDIRKGLVKRWPVVKFAKATYDHNTCYMFARFNSKKDYEQGMIITGFAIEYETEHGKQLALLAINEYVKRCIIISNHAIRRVRERLHWEEVDWYTLVQRIMTMAYGATWCQDIHRYGDPLEFSYGCIKGEFCGREMGDGVLMFRTFIGKEQMNDWRVEAHQKAADWYERNKYMFQLLGKSFEGMQHLK